MSRILIEKIIEFRTTIKESPLKQGNSIYTFLNPVSYLAAMKMASLFARFDGLMVYGAILATAIR